jgi:hypothetical protein
LARDSSPSAGEVGSAGTRQLSLRWSGGLGRRAAAFPPPCGEGLRVGVQAPRHPSTARPPHKGWPPRRDSPRRMERLLHRGCLPHRAHRRRMDLRRRKALPPHKDSPPHTERLPHRGCQPHRANRRHKGSRPHTGWPPHMAHWPRTGWPPHRANRRRKDCPPRRDCRPALPARQLRPAPLPGCWPRYGRPRRRRSPPAGPFRTEACCACSFQFQSIEAEGGAQYDPGEAAGKSGCEPQPAV